MSTKTNKKKSTMLITLLVGVALIIGGTAISVSSKLKPVDKSRGYEHVFTVDSGDTLGSVAKKLADEGIVNSAGITKMYGKFKGLDKVVEGNFELNTTMSTEEILTSLNDPEAAISNEVMITFPEGMWARDMAERIGNMTSVSQEELIELWNDETYLKQMIKKYDFLTDDILNDDLKMPLEGYLAPNTYNFYIENTAEDITSVLLNQTQKIYNENKNAFESSKHSVHEIFTLASITQYESGHADENPVIAGIWENRLADNMKLESSVTVCYAIYDYKDWKECEQRIDIDSPYNTYQNSGIPIGPVTNPGESAIIATLKPEDTDYLFFIADVEGDGQIHYAKTFDEHKENINKYLR